MIRIVRWLRKSWCHCGREMIVDQYAFGFYDMQTSMFGTGLNIRILQKHLFVLCSTRSLILGIHIYSVVPLPKWLQLPERFKYLCRTEKHTRSSSHCSIIFGWLLARKLHGKELVFLPLSVLLSQCSHHAIHMVEHVIVHSDGMMQSNSISFRHPKHPVLEWPSHFDHILDDGPFILRCVDRSVITVFWILVPLGGELF